MRIRRREFLKAAGLVSIAPPWPAAAQNSSGTLVNDIHSQLNQTRVRRIVDIDSLRSLQQAVRRAADERSSICIAGGRHAMGGQQFGANAVMLDMRKYSRILGLDAERGHVDVEAGIMWPALIDELVRRQAGAARQWGIAQKQTGADRLTIGGALAANVHGRGLTMKPMVGDVESFRLVDARGRPRNCTGARTRTCSRWRSAAIASSVRSPP